MHLQIQSRAPLRKHVSQADGRFTKPRLLNCRDTFGGISRVGSVRGENSSGSKNQIFSAWDTPGRKIVDFFLTNNSRRGIIMTFSMPWRGIFTFWQGLCTFWQELGHLGKNQYILARISTFWQENFGLTPCQCVPARKISEFFLPGSCTTTNIAKPPRLSGY